MNNKIAKLLFGMIENLRSENVFEYLKELEVNQYLERHEIISLQKKKLNKLLDFTMKNNSYYKNKYKNHDVLNSFECLPILEKEELRDNYKKIITFSEKKLDLVETSGSTGIPIQFYRDRVVFGYTLASLYRGRRWWGIDIGEKEAMLWGVPVKLKKRIKVKLKDLILNRFREDEYNINPKILKKFYLDIKNKKPNYIFGYSSMVYEFALYLKENNLNINDVHLKAAICTAEKINDYQRIYIEEIFGCKVVSEYGSTESGIISHQCKCGSNHISDDCVLVEIVDSNNIPIKDGGVGRVLVTVLNSFSSPIIRYDIGDFSSKIAGPCECGVNLSILGSVEGRTSNVVVGPNGSVYHSIIFYYIFKELTENYGGVKQYKIIQKRVDSLEIYIVKGANFSDEANNFIKKQIEDKFGQSMNLKIIYLDYIERSPSGKLKDFETNLDTSSYLSKIYRQC